jgi:hypothetical protein
MTTTLELEIMNGVSLAFQKKGEDGYSGMILLSQSFIISFLPFSLKTLSCSY